MGKNKTLPKNFEDLLNEGDLAKLKAVFDKASVDARGGIWKQTALAFSECPDELARWLVEQGADMNATDQYGKTPLMSRARDWRGNLGILFDLGVDVNYGDPKNGTALLAAVSGFHPKNVRQLIERGARVDQYDKNSISPLAKALQTCSNTSIVYMLEIAGMLLEAGASKTPEMLDYVTRIGTNFEFMRSGFNPESREETSDALDSLYVLFDVPPVPRREMHDGKSRIVTKSSRWQERHEELWEMLVPPTGAAKTVQGEVIRISGRISHELENNGGGNWDQGFRQMADAWLTHIRSGNSLLPEDLEEAVEFIREIKRSDGDARRMSELSTVWVGLNPDPVALPTPPPYER